MEQVVTQVLTQQSGYNRTCALGIAAIAAMMMEMTSEMELSWRYQEHACNAPKSGMFFQQKCSIDSALNIANLLPYCLTKLIFIVVGNFL